MKIAVLLTGQPRYLEQSAFWWKNRVFPSSFKDIKVDYYCYFWDDGSKHLWNRAYDLFNPVRVHVSDYNTVIADHRNKIKKLNENYYDWHLVPDHVKENICFFGNNISDYGKNFHGMFISTAHAARMTGELTDYDVVIKTRTDAIFNPMNEHQWLSIFGNMYKNPAFNNNIFAPWLRIKQGSPFFGDLCFIGQPKLMHNFMKNIDEDLIKICTKDKFLFGELLVNNYGPVAHWMWSKLSLYSKTDWLAFSVVWPVPFDVALLRTLKDINTVSFKDIQVDYKAYEAEHHKEHISYIF